MRLNRVAISVIWLLAFVLVAGCSSSNDGSSPPSGSNSAAQPGDTSGAGSAGAPGDAAPGGGTGTAGQVPDRFPLPVYDNWTLGLDREETSSRTVIFRYEGERAGVMEQYVADLEQLGLDATVDGFRIIAEGELQGQPLSAQIAFQQSTDLTQVTISLKHPSN